MTTRSVQLFQDEINAIGAEEFFARSLDHGRAPFRAEPHQHVGEGGATTAYYQDAKIVGMSSRIRDDLNRTFLVCISFR